MKKMIPIGYEDIRELIEHGFYYVDKTLMIKELLDNRAKVNLITRPRRFGKTLNQSMIRRFFELELDDNGRKIDNGYIFKDLKISACGESYMSWQGEYPVINLSLKSGKQPDYEMAYASLIDEIAKEYKRHSYILGTDKLTEEEKGRFRALMERRAGKLDNAKSLEFLSYCLSKFHQKKCHYSD